MAKSKSLRKTKCMNSQTEKSTSSQTAKVRAHKQHCAKMYNLTNDKKHNTMLPKCTISQAQQKIKL